MSDYFFVGSAARELGIPPRAITMAFYFQKLHGMICPIADGRRIIPRSYLPVIVRVLQEQAPPRVAGTGALTMRDLPSSATLMLSPADVAGELGLSMRTVRWLDLEGRLPAPVRIRQAVRWPRETLVAWTAAGAPRRDEWEATCNGV